MRPTEEKKIRQITSTTLIQLIQPINIFSSCAHDQNEPKKKWKNEKNADAHNNLILNVLK